MDELRARLYFDEPCAEKNHQESKTCFLLTCALYNSSVVMATAAAVCALKGFKTCTFA